MAQRKVDLNTPTKGMMRDKHPANLQRGEYYFALNALHNDELVGDFLFLGNEPSNLPCKTFDDYVVVGGVVHNTTGDIYVFLRDKDGVSSIGRIRKVREFEINVESKCGDCDKKNVQDIRLENTKVDDLCDLEILIKDDCNGCLNFSLKYPIKRAILKDENTGLFLYWTDGYNPPRVINLSKIDEYKKHDAPSCGVEGEPVCVDCDKLRIFKKYDFADYSKISVEQGGNLEEGVYRFVIAYTDELGNELTDYESVSGDIVVFGDGLYDFEKRDMTNKRIVLNLKKLDKSFKFYRVGVIFTSTFDNVTSCFLTDKQSISDNVVDIATLDNFVRTDLNHIYKRRLHIETTDMLDENEGRLFQYGLKIKEEINLQPIANLMGAFLRWQTVIAPYDFYKRGENSKYKSYLRDEVYPFFISFLMKGGYKTPLYLLANRPILANHNTVVDNTDTRSVIDANMSCSNNTRNKYWQYYDTSETLGICQNDGVGSEVITVDKTQSCYSYLGSFNVSDNILDIDVDESHDFNLVDLGGNQLGAGSRPATSEDEKEYVMDIIEEYLNNFDCDADSSQPVLCNLLNSLPEGCRLKVANTCSTPQLVDEHIDVTDVTNLDFDITYDFGIDVLQNDSSGNPFGSLSPGIVNPPYINRGENMFQRCYNIYRRLEYSNITKQTAQYLNTLDSAGVYNHSYKYFNTDTSYFVGEQIIGNVNDAHLSGKLKFPDYVRKNALWFKHNMGFVPIKFYLSDVKYVDGINDYLDKLSRYGGKAIFRISFWDDTTLIHSEIVNTDDGYSYRIDPNMVSSGQLYVSIEAPIVEDYSIKCGGDGQVGERPALIAGTFKVGYKLPDKKHYRIYVGNIFLYKRNTYKYSCDVTIPRLGNCETVPFEYGKFSVWQSLENYPDNKELFDSSILDIEIDDIPVEYRGEFEQYFSSKVIDNKYVLNNNTKLLCSPIRHYKFPSNKTTPFVINYDSLHYERAYIVPIGVKIDEAIVHSFLNIAVKNGLLSQEDRDSIVGYEIYRGDRLLDKSILAKGILYDMYEYKDEKGYNVIYSNYPYNDLGKDTLFYKNKNFTGDIKHPYNGEKNNKYTFLSPDIYFGDIDGVGEFGIEGVLRGSAEWDITKVEGYPKYVLLTPAAKVFIKGIAFSEVIADFVEDVASIAQGGNIGLVAAIVSAPMLALRGITRYIEYMYKWVKMFKDLGVGVNFAKYYVGRGDYYYFDAGIDVINNHLRGIEYGKMLHSGRYEYITDGNIKRVNNYNREYSYLLDFGNYFIDYVDSGYNTVDNNSIGDGSKMFTKCSKDSDKDIASIYGSLRVYKPSQYGGVYDIKPVSTGKRIYFDDNDSCSVSFGGDIYISPFTVKRKFPVFLRDAFGLADRTQFLHSFYRNIGGAPRYFVDYELTNPEYDSDLFIGKTITILGEEVSFGVSIPSVLVYPLQDHYNLDCFNSDKFYVKPDSRFYLYVYSFVNFFVESEYNGWFRQSGRDLKDTFYPKFPDTEALTQPENVKIDDVEKFEYSNALLYDRLHSWDTMLPDTYSKEYSKEVSYMRNSVVWSEQDSSELSLSDPWLVYKPLNFYEFKKEYGDLVRLKRIESQKMLGLFTNQLVLFNAIDILKERITPDTTDVGTGGIFAQRPYEYVQSDIGFSGSLNYPIVSTQFGHFFADALRGKVFRVDYSGKLNDITIGMSQWFKEHLPFKILRDFPNIDSKFVDNHFRGFGITFAWDNKNNRLILTKKDKIVKENYKGKIEYRGGDFFINGDIINEEDYDKYFDDVGFTLTYSPVLDSWVSYMSYTPNYYFELPDYFISGYNFGRERGLWAHLLTNKSYQVFGGKLYPFIVEYPIINSGADRVLNTLKLKFETRLYQNEYDWSYVRDYLFDRMWVYNERAISGYLNLNLQKKNSLRDKLIYPKVTGNGIDILATYRNGKVTINHLFDYEKSDANNQPMWIYDINRVMKEMNSDAVAYNKRFKDRMRGDWFLVGVENNSESRYKLFVELLIDKSNYDADR